MTPRRAGRVGWTLAALTAVGAMEQAAFRLPDVAELRDRFDPFPTFPIITVATLAAAVVGALIVSRQPRNPVGWLFCVANFLAQLGLSTLAYSEHSGLRSAPLPLAHEAAWLETMLSAPFALSALVFLLLLFPDGRLPSARWRVLAWVTSVNFLVVEGALAVIAGAPSRAVPLNDPQVHGTLLVVAVTSQALLFVTVLLAVVSIVARRRRATGDQRQQLRMVSTAAAVFGASLVPLVLSDPLHALGVPTFVPETLFYLAYGTLPVGVGLAILQHGLYGIDVLINRAVVVGTIAAASTAGYVAVVVALGAVLGQRIGSGVTVSLSATALVAVAVQPARRWVHRFADRLAYGERATPYEVLASFTRRLGDTLSVDEVLPRMASAAAQGVGASAASVRVRLADGTHRAVDWPSQGPCAYDRVIAVRHAGEPIGEIALALPAGHTLDRTAEALLGDLAAQAGLALHNVRLTAELAGRLAELSQQSEELESSRRRLLAAQTGERRRLEARITTDVRPHLAAITAGVGEVERLLAEPVRAAAVVDRLCAEATAALEALREIARGVFPPLLVDRGLAPALAALARTSGGAVEITVAEPLPRYPLPVEATAYFCCSRVVTEAGAATLPVHVTVSPVDGRLVLTLLGVPLTCELVAAVRDRVDGTGGTLTVLSGDRLRAELPARAVPQQGQNPRASSTPGPNPALETNAMAPHSATLGP